MDNSDDKPSSGTSEGNEESATLVEQSRSNSNLASSPKDSSVTNANGTANGSATTATASPSSGSIRTPLAPADTNNSNNQVYRKSNVFQQIRVNSKFESKTKSAFYSLWSFSFLTQSD